MLLFMYYLLQTVTAVPKPISIVDKPGSRHRHLAIRTPYYTSASVRL